MKITSPRRQPQKCPTGIHGFDDISGGGIPRGRTTLVIGGPGCGKTVLSLQLLVNGATQAKEAGIFVAFEESTRDIIANARSFGWDLPALERKNLFFLDARLTPDTVIAGEFDLGGMLSALGAKAKAIGARRIVFDGIDVLLGVLDDPAAERREMYRIRNWLVETGLTGIITQKADDDGVNRRNGFLQFMVDCVVVLRQRVVDGSAFRDLRIMKYRGSAFAADEFPITLSADALQLTHRGPTELTYRVSNARVSTGLPRLDHMLAGGVHRGSIVLVSGAPGTAKSTLGGLFAAAACARGERTLYVSFDEGAAQIVRNLRSVGVRLAPYVKSGLLRIYATRTRGPNIEDQFGALRAIVEEQRPKCMVIDPLSALSTKVAHVASADATQRFLDFLKRKMITVVSTSLTEGLITDEASAAGISTIADTWIHVSYIVRDGERNRALTIVKARGIGHSNQVRELTLAGTGVTLTDVFIAKGEVLMGVARWQWEQQEQATKKLAKSATDLKVLHLKLAQAEAAARLQVVQTDMDARSAEMEMLANVTEQTSERRVTERAILRKLRHADSEARTKPSGTGAARAPATPVSRRRR